MRHQSDQTSIASRQERAAGRILDDESLRDSLTDDEFQPILDWALGVTDALAESTAHLPDDATDSAIDAAVQTIREVAFMVQEVIAKHSEREAADRRNALQVIGNLWAGDNPTKLDTAALQTIRQKLGTLADRLDAEADVTGSEIAAEIAAALASGKRP